MGYLIFLAFSSMKITHIQKSFHTRIHNNSISLRQVFLLSPLGLLENTPSALVTTGSFMVTTSWLFLILLPPASAFLNTVVEFCLSLNFILVGLHSIYPLYLDFFT